MARKYLLFFVIFLTSQYSFSQFQNYRIFPSAVQQIEPSIVRHPANPQILFASAFTITPTLQTEGCYVSTNGGLTWTGANSLNGVPNQNTHRGDPGPIIDKNGRFILTRQGGFPFGMFSHYSTDMGTNWQTTASPIATGDNDKGAPGTDDVPSSSFYGRTYLAWTRYTTPFPIVISYTTDGAVTWSGVIQINNSFNSNYSFGPYLAIGPGGIVYAAWASAIPTSPFTEDCIGFAKSTNGGVNWQITECAIDINGIRTSQLTPWTIRANSFPLMDVDKTGGSRNGWIYIVTTCKNIAPAGSDPDIILYRSTNSGNTWSSGKRVNNDAINNGRNQFLPAIRVDEDGGLNIIYYDGRNSPDSVDVYLSRSTDGGNNFTDFKISDHKFKPKPATGSQAGNMGDNIGITSGNGKLYPVWMSNYGTDTFNVWSANIDYTTIGINQISSEVPFGYSLEQNYPNPFNPETNIQFSIPKSGFVSLKIYDLLGREISEIVNQDLKPGTYQTHWYAEEQPSGVYFYRLSAQGFSVTKKMLLVK